MLTSRQVTMMLMTSLVVVIAAVLYDRVARSEGITSQYLTSDDYVRMTSQITSHLDKPKRIAVIGGGISGTSSSFFLRSLFGDDVTIELFEQSRDKLCGRMSLVEIGNKSYESGASILHPSNLYADFIRNNFNLSKRENSGKLRFEFWNNEGKQFVMKENLILLIYNMITMFGWSIYNMYKLVNNFIYQFSSVYMLQASGKSYENVGDLLHAMGQEEEFVQATQQTACDLCEEKGIGKLTRDILVNGAMLVNYGQNCSQANGFAGAVAMAGFQPGIWAVQGGNRQLCDVIMHASRANLIREHVKKIKFDDGKFQLITSNSLHGFYDIVILAAPLYFNGPDIDLSEVCENQEQCPNNKNPEKSYQTTVATFVRGKLRSEKFNCFSPDDCSHFYVMVNPEASFRSVAVQIPVDFNKSRDKLISRDGIATYKIFSSKSLTHDELDDIFEIRTEIKEVEWKAYPQYRPPEKLSSFIIHSSGLYYTSPIEWSASTVETSLISAKNAALLAYNRFFKLH